ncbi:hypothetical protein [Flexibacterium corallicola]|uniref:hypothetical protein n=1 Tax=Flexibacterium corallicola TaxID=3037259 RepID=UPI00286F1ACD|nr:hypothetical protein [Pseudovibrio sp. M1P-2-3]
MRSNEGRPSTVILLRTTTTTGSDGAGKAQFVDGGSVTGDAPRDTTAVKEGYNLASRKSSVVAYKDLIEILGRHPEWVYDQQ